jgi:hypothetical protein
MNKKTNARTDEITDAKERTRKGERQAVEVVQNVEDKKLESTGKCGERLL